MSKELGIKIHEIATDGLPNKDETTGRVAFIFDGCVVSGWALSQDKSGDIPWEANGDVGRHGRLYGVTHWIEFPVPVCELK